MKRSDVIALIVTTALLLGNIAAIGPTGRERAKRAVCLSHLRQLTQAWTLYAEASDGKIVNGAGGMHFSKSAMTSDGTWMDLVERAWVGRAWSRNWNNPNVADTGFSEEQKRLAVEEGALWPFVSDANVYRCPAARPHEFVNYSIVDAMNGLHRMGTTSQGGHHPGAIGKRIGRTTLWIKNTAEIDAPPAAERMVFVDEGAVTPDSLGVHYTANVWWDDPPVRHNDGATVSWADGHASHVAWRGAETIEFGQSHPDYYGGGGFMPQTAEGIEDLESFRRAVWGRLHNEPTEP